MDSHKASAHVHFNEDACIEIKPQAHQEVSVGLEGHVGDLGLGAMTAADNTLHTANCSSLLYVPAPHIAAFKPSVNWYAAAGELRTY